MTMEPVIKKHCVPEGGTGAADYIIAGAGCAGLSLAMHMAASGKFSDQKILLVDQDGKRSNDRTWCFWEEESGLFEPVVFRKWNQVEFHGDQFNRQLSLAPYQYKMIRGIDFYNYCLRELSQHKNITICQEKVDAVFSDEKGTGIIVNGEPVFADHVFNSILFKKPELKKKDLWLLQHFKGWVIQTKDPVFNIDAATLMDFRTDQQWGTAFCYVLPFSANRALIEYTLFSANKLEPEEYNTGLRTYINEVLKIPAYEILDEETGVIPMSNYKFSPGINGIINIGTAGGQTKGSSGYTFHFIQKHSKFLVEAMIRDGKPSVVKQPSRYHFYDSVLLQILQNNSLPGKSIFTRLFSRNKTADVLRFLDNESTLREELGIISSLPVLPFTKAAMKHIF